MAIYVNLGGSCECCSAFRKNNVLHIPSPFDWLGVPTSSLEKLFNENWIDDVFEFNQTITFDSPIKGLIGLRDLKYKINSLHHFNKFNSEELISFRDKMKKRWISLIANVKEIPKSLVFVHREYYPEYGEKCLNSIEQKIQQFSPESRIVLLGSEPKNINHAIYINCKNDQKYFLQKNWLAKWKFLFANIDLLEKGQTYDL